MSESKLIYRSTPGYEGQIVELWKEDDDYVIKLVSPPRNLSYYNTFNSGISEYVNACNYHNVSPQIKDL